MLIKELFYTMNQMVDHISSKLPTEDPSALKMLEGQVVELKKMSDSILDEWISFEENLTDKIGKHFPSIVSKSILSDIHEQLDPNKIETQLNGNIPEFNRAKGYFDLGIYQEAFPILQKVVELEPDQEFARLYYAYSALFLEKKEIALQNFTLLSKTSKQVRIQAVCMNALGIFFFDEGDLENAHRSFKQAIQFDSGLFVAYYNLGLVYYSQSLFREAIQSWEEYLTLTQDQELELLFYLSSAYLKLGEYQKAIHLWKVNSMANQNQILFQLGHFFEDSHQYEEAIKSYQNLLLRSPNDSEAIHGLAWNYWLLTNDHHKVVPLLKKALSLQPMNVNIAFSLAWIYFHMEDVVESKKIVGWIFLQDEEHSLAQALSFLIALKQKDWKSAEAWGEKLKAQRDLHTRALGDLFIGKLRLNQHCFQDAIDSFRRSVTNNPNLKESYLLQGLAYYFNNEMAKAEEIWKKHHYISMIK